MVKRWKRFCSSVLVMALTAAMCLSDVSYVKAEEYEELPAYEMEYDDPATPIGTGTEANVRIEVSSRIISFGHVSKGQTVPYQALNVVNKSDISIDLDYQLSDAERMFNLSLNGPLALAPGQGTTFYIGMDGNKNQGYYTANLILCPRGYIAAAANIGLSAEITGSGPQITYMGIRPDIIDMSKGSSYQFVSDVRGENNPDYGVNWSVEGANSEDTAVDNNGNLHIGADETATQVFVRTRSIQDSSKTTTATIKIKEGNYNVSTSANPSNGGSTGGGGNFTPGTNAEVYAAPNNGFRFVSWSRNGQVVSNNPKYAINNIRENYNLVANFEQTNSYVKVLSNQPEGGNVSASGNVAYNGSFSLSANPTNGYVFEGWYENGNRISGDSQTTINNIVSNREFHANFVKNVFQVNLQVNPQGAGSVAGSGSYSRGTGVSINAKAFDGYEFDCWTVNNNLVSNSANYTVSAIDRDYILVANFKKKSAVTYTITSSVDGGQGEISPSGAASIPAQADVTYTFAPAKDYTIAAVTVDGKNLGVLPSYTFKNLDGNHKISVKFVQIPDEHLHAENKEENHKEIINNPGVGDEGVVDDSAQYKPDDVEEEALDSFLEYTELTGLLQHYNMSEEEARTLIRNKQDITLLEKACENQYLSVSVVNEYADNMRETESVGYMDVVSVPNLAQVVDSILTEDEKLDIFKGDYVSINFNLFANNKLQTSDDKKMVNQAIKDKVEIGNFFEAVLMKTTSGNAQIVTELEVPMTIELNIPQELKAEGREFLIMRAHQNGDGTVSIDYLPNESTDQSKIVFSTDKFSSYAIAYRGGKDVGLTQATFVRILFGAIGVAIVLTIVLGIVLVNNSSKRRRRRRK